MVMKVTAEKLGPLGKDKYYSDHEAYTVKVNSQRILTVVTDSHKVASKWFKSLLSTYPRSPSTHIVVGVQPNTEDYYYQVYTICVGSQCLVYSPNMCEAHVNNNPEARLLNNFFSDPRVVAVGVKMEAFANKLNKDHGILIPRRVDVNEAAAEVYSTKADAPDMARLRYRDLVEYLLGKDFDVVRGSLGGSWYEITKARAKSVTVDAYLLYLLGNELLIAKAAVGGGGVTLANPSPMVYEQKKKMKKASKVPMKKKVSQKAMMTQPKEEEEIVLEEPMVVQPKVEEVFKEPVKSQTKEKEPMKTQTKGKIHIEVPMKDLVKMRKSYLNQKVIELMKQEKSNQKVIGLKETSALVENVSKRLSRFGVKDLF